MDGASGGTAGRPVALNGCRASHASTVGTTTDNCSELLERPALFRRPFEESATARGINCASFSGRNDASPFHR